MKLKERVATRVAQSDRKLVEAAAVRAEVDLSTWLRRAVRRQALRELESDGEAEQAGEGRAS